MGFSAGVCNLCGTGCGHFLQIEDGRVCAVAPQRAHPVSQGRLCLRGWHLHETLRTKDRLTAPAVRTGGVLRPVSYAEATAETVKRLTAIKKNGGQIGVIGSARSANEDNFLLAKLSREALGTTQVGVAAQASHGQALSALKEVFGLRGAVGSLENIDQAQSIVILGGDLAKLNPIVESRIHRAALRGAHVLAMSSARTQTAKLATRHLQHKPGSKRLAVAGLMKALVAARGKSFPEQALPGFAELEKMLTGLQPGAIDATTGIRYADLQAAAERLNASESVMVVFASGISGLDAATACAAVDLAVLTGKLGREGSGVIPIAGIANLQGSFDVGLGSSRVEDDPFRLLAARAPDLKGLIVVDHDDGVIHDREAIAALDCVVYLSAFGNRFADLAHVVLPIAAYTDYSGTYTASDRRVQLSSKKTEAPDGVLPAWRVFGDLGKAMGHGWSYNSEREIFVDIAKTVSGYANLSYDLLAQESGRQWGPATIPAPERLLAFSAATPAVVNAEYPFALSIGQAQHFWHQNNLMRKSLTPRREYDATLLLYPEGFVEISTADAKRLGVRDKARVKVISAQGEMKIAVKVSADIQVGAACIPYFIEDMVAGFLVKHDSAATLDEDSVIPIRIEKV